MLGVARPAVMAILNVTSDSFYDGGRYSELEAAIRRAHAVVAEGADVLDLGGESTRPGSEGVSEAEEIRRVLPVVEALVNGPEPYPLPISIDTSRAEVARKCLDAGAHIINDVSGGRRQPEILSVCAAYGAGLVLMHMRGTPRSMQDDVTYEDLLSEVVDFLAESCAEASAAGVPVDAQAIDPGIGFGKSSQGCLDLLANLHRFESLARPVLIGASRKSFLERAFGHEVDQRLEGSIAVAATSTWCGASILRVHDVAATRRAVDVVSGLREQRR